MCCDAGPILSCTRANRAPLARRHVRDAVAEILGLVAWREGGLFTRTGNPHQWDISSLSSRLPLPLGKVTPSLPAALRRLQGGRWACASMGSVILNQEDYNTQLIHGKQTGAVVLGRVKRLGWQMYQSLGLPSTVLFLAASQAGVMSPHSKGCLIHGKAQRKPVGQPWSVKTSTAYGFDWCACRSSMEKEGKIH